MRKGFLIYEGTRKYLTIYEEAVSHILYDFATDPFWISLSMRKIFIFFFISVAAVCVVVVLFEGILQYWVDFIAQFLPKNVIHTFFCYRCVLVGLTQYVTVMAGIAIGKSWQSPFIYLLAIQEIQIEWIYLLPEIIEILKVRTREAREGWPLLTLETEVHGDSKSANEGGSSLVGS